jgi:hypothetical protein
MAQAALTEAERGAEGGREAQQEPWLRTGGSSASATSRRGRWNAHEASFYSPRRPVASKLLAQAWDERAQHLHEQRLRRMHAQVDSAPPASLQHLRRSTKEQQPPHERDSRIAHGNQILQRRLRRIQHRPNAKLVPSRTNRRTAHSDRSAPPADSGEQPAPSSATSATTGTLGSLKFGEACKPFSLNGPAKRAAEKRICEENHAMNARVCAQHSRRSKLSPRGLEKDWLRNMDYGRIASKHGLQPPKDAFAHA